MWRYPLRCHLGSGCSEKPRAWLSYPRGCHFFLTQHPSPCFWKHHPNFLLKITSPPLADHVHLVGLTLLWFQRMGMDFRSGPSTWHHVFLAPVHMPSVRMWLKPKWWIADPDHQLELQEKRFLFCPGWLSAGNSWAAPLPSCRKALPAESWPAAGGERFLNTEYLICSSETIYAQSWNLGLHKPICFPSSQYVIYETLIHSSH